MPNSPERAGSFTRFAERCGWLLPFFIEKLLQTRGMIAQSLYGLGAIWLIWAIFDEPIISKRIPHRFYRWRAIPVLLMGLAFPLALEQWAPVAPSPKYDLWLDYYNFVDGLLVNGVTWHSQYRIYHFSVTNLWPAHDAVSIRIMMEMPAIVRRKRLEPDPILAEGVRLHADPQMRMEGCNIVDINPATGEHRDLTPKVPPGSLPNTVTGIWQENTNQVFLEIAKLHNQGTVSLELLVDYSDPCGSWPGNVDVDYSYESYFGRMRTKRDRFVLDSIPDPPKAKIASRALKLTPLLPGCPAWGADCIVAARESLIEPARMPTPLVAATATPTAKKEAIAADLRP